MNLTRYPQQMRENLLRKIEVKRSTDSWNKIRDLRHPVPPAAELLWNRI